MISTLTNIPLLLWTQSVLVFDQFVLDVLLLLVGLVCSMSATLLSTLYFMNDIKHILFPSVCALTV